MFKYAFLGAVIFAFLVPGTAAAAEAIEVGNLFTWATGSTIPDWGRGGLYAALGLIGALVTVFTLIGGAVPGTAGFARIEAGLKRVEEREKILDAMIQSTPKTASEIEAVEKATNNLRDDMRADRRRQFLVAASLYAILGAFFASMLAQDMLQAIVIGAGWTAYMGALGLKRDYAERKTVKDDITVKLEEALSKEEQGTPLSDNDRTFLMAEVEVARAL